MLIEVFSSPICPHCPGAKRVVEEVVDKLSCDDIEVKHIDVTEDPGSAEKYSIMAVPTIVVDGEVAFVGAPTAQQFEEYLKKKLNR